jgi:hypothetical protein
MAALSANRNTPALALGLEFVFAPASGVTIYRGALVMLDSSGDAKPGAAATSQTAAGRAETSTAEDATAVTVRRGIFLFGNSASSDAITKAEWGKTVYIVDDQTVAKTNGSSTRSAAGICRGVTAAGVWVEM